MIIFINILIGNIAIVFLTLAILGHSLRLESYLPKLPLCIGEGYNIYQGNPMTDKIDLGFILPIFAFTFDKGEKTEDGKFRISDYTLSH